jgi:hypothetical protein
MRIIGIVKTIPTMLGVNTAEWFAWLMSPLRLKAQQVRTGPVSTSGYRRAPEWVTRHGIGDFVRVHTVDSILHLSAKRIDPAISALGGATGVALLHWS